MLGDIHYDKTGWFYRDNGDGTYDTLSTLGGVTKVDASGMNAPTIVLVRDGAPTNHGRTDLSMPTRVASVMAKRYAT